MTTACFPAAAPLTEDFSLIYADPALLVVNKPSGLLSVPGRGEDKQDCLIHRVQRTYPDALIVHRLDCDTSGLIVIARGKAMHRQPQPDVSGASGGQALCRCRRRPPPAGARQG